ncbi:RICIN domain-containing protein [Luteimonas salinilitoris]|uniref:RICIN domain-containing protein n=1 Tax=Luteimonas salinilitoris TaxID=3237697 RepID=A0ABV4HWI0_9GAMM
MKKEILSALAFAVVAGFSSNASATISTIESSSYQTCLIPASGSAEALVVGGVCSAVQNQSWFWRLEFIGQSEHVRIRNTQTNLCLDLQTVSTADSVRVVQRACGTSYTQRWTLSTVAGIARTFRNGHSAKCLAMDNSTGIIYQWGCNGTTSQRWWMFL